MNFSTNTIPFLLIADDFLSESVCDNIVTDYKTKKLIDWSQQAEGFYYCNFENTELLNQNILSSLAKYKDLYPSIELTSDKWSLVNVNFKWFKPGYSFNSWHCEHTKAHSTRILCFQIYLSDHQCGTEFYDPNTTVHSKKGRAVIFPTFWTHVHRGQVCPENTDRFLLSTYIHYV